MGGKGVRREAGRGQNWVGEDGQVSWTSERGRDSGRTIFTKVFIILWSLQSCGGQYRPSLFCTSSGVKASGVLHSVREPMFPEETPVAT